MNNKKEPSELNHYLKLLVRVSAFIFVATIISKLATYGYKIIIARYFGAETYGLFSLALIVIGIASAIASIGLNEGIVRYISFYMGKKDFGSIKKLISNSKIIFFFSGLIVMLILIVIAPLISEKIFHSKDFTGLIRAISISIPFMLFAGLYLAIIRGFQKIKTYSFLVNIYQNIIRLGLIFIFILIGVGANSIALSYVLTFVGLAILSFYYSRKEIVSMPTNVEKTKNKIMPEIISFSWPLLFVGILYNVFYWSDSLVLGYLTNASNVGIYNAAVTIISLFSIAPDLFMQLLFPLISFKLSEGKRELVRKLIQQVIKWIYLINIPLFVFLFLFPEQGVYILFGKEYLEAAAIIKILSIGALFLNLVNLSTSLMSIKGKTKLVLFNSLIFTVLNLALNFLLIPKYGMAGAAYATVIAAAVFCLCFLIQIRKEYGFNLLTHYFSKIFIIGAIIFIIGYFLRVYVSYSFWLVMLTCSLLIFLYIFMLYLNKIFDEDDTDIIKTIFKKTKLNVRKLT